MPYTATVVVLSGLAAGARSAPPLSLIPAFLGALCSLWVLFLLAERLVLRRRGAPGWVLGAIRWAGYLTLLVFVVACAVVGIGLVGVLVLPRRT
ncbi:MAG TPA: hypothetical protein VNK05_09440 [Chloroflexota bacterium]|nr:hypothetical protein [Chloroflexota bacterium]